MFKYKIFLLIYNRFDINNRLNIVYLDIYKNKIEI